MRLEHSRKQETGALHADTEDRDREPTALSPTCGPAKTREDHPIDSTADGEAFGRGREALVAEAALARKTAAMRRETATRLRADADAIQARMRVHSARAQARPQRPSDPAPESASGDGRGAFILEEDHELAMQLPETHRRRATTLLLAPVIDVGRGSWAPPRLDATTSYGLLLLDGLVSRRVRVADAAAIEILGPGDVMRPWDDDPLADALPAHAEWEICQPARLAVLDGRITALIARWPPLSLALSGRLLRRNRRLSYLLAVSHLRRIEDRLLGTLWCLAASWGRVTPLGVTVPINLTHQVLGEMAGARRSSVTLALVTLRDRGLVSRLPDGTYVLAGDPPLWQRAPFDRLVAADGALS